MQKNHIINFCNTWLEILSPLKDVEFQRRVWFRKEGPEVSIFDEAIDSFLQGYEYLIKDLNVSSSKNEDKNFYQYFFNKIKPLNDKVDKFLNDRISMHNASSEAKLLNDPNWLQIVSSAEQLSNVMNQRIFEVENEG